MWLREELLTAIYFSLDLLFIAKPAASGPKGEVEENLQIQMKTSGAKRTSVYKSLSGKFSSPKLFLPSCRMVVNWESVVQKLASPLLQTYSSVTLRGIPLGRAFRCLLLQRTTVSRQVQSLGHCGRGMQLASSWPIPWDTREAREVVSKVDRR